jgi:glycosyltransferase involved in cell wall biosynthesis
METRPTKRVGVYHYSGFTHLRGGTLKTIRLLADAGYDVTVSLLPPRDGAPSHIEEQLPPNVTVRRVRLWTRVLPRFRGTSVKLLELMVRHVWHAWRSVFDLYVAIDPPAALPVFLGARFRRRRVVYLALELFAEMPWVKGRPLWRLVDRYLCPRVDAIVTMDAYRAQHMVQQYKSRPPLTIRNTPPSRNVERTRRLNEILKSRGIDAEKIALCLGNIEPGRNIETLIEAAQAFQQNVALVFMGWCEKDYFEKITAQIANLHLQHRVFIHPSVPPDEVWDFLGSAHVGLLVYRNLSLNYYYSAGASLRLYEYLMAGLPVVAPDFPGFPELVEGEGLGACVDPDDPLAIAEAVNTLVADEAEWNAMRNRAAEAAKDRYNWEIDGGKLLRLCENLMANR